MTKLPCLAIDKILVNNIARNYSTLHHTHKLLALLSVAYPSEDFANHNKPALHQRLNDLLMTHYKGEQFLKYILFRHFINKKTTAAFEIKVNHSRADFLTVNGYSSSFEIKSTLDNLEKLRKQATDYHFVFDYNYVVVDQKHLKNAIKLIPPSFGIWSINENKKVVHRKAVLNKTINYTLQLNLLNKKELHTAFPEVAGNREDIEKRFTAEAINRRFRKTLKLRYEKRWNFIKEHADNILPIDIQFFFNKNIVPEIIYLH